MTVKELITKLLDCNMDSKVLLGDNIPFKDEFDEESDGSVYEIENIHEYAGLCELEFVNRNSKFYGL